MLPRDGKSKKQIKSEPNRDYLWEDFPDMPVITTEVRAQNSKRVFTGGVRVNNAMYRTDSEKEEYIINSLDRKLP